MQLKSLACAILLLPLSLVEAQKIPLPPGGESLLPADLKNALKFYSSEYGTFHWVAAGHSEFHDAMEVETLRRPKNPWDLQLSLTLQTPLKKGDVLWAGIWMRTLKSRTESGEGVSELALEKNSEPYDKLVTRDLTAGSEWQSCAIAFTAPRDYAGGEYQLCLRFGYNPQIVQIGGLQVLNYKHLLRRADLLYGYFSAHYDKPGFAFQPFS